MLSVGDEFAGAQGKCPTCGTLVTFQGPPAAAAPPPGGPPPGSYQASPYTPPGEAGMPGYAPAPPGPPRDNTELFTMLGLGGAAFSVLLLLIGTLLAWVPVIHLSGIHLGDGRMVFCLSLLLGALLGLSFLTRPLLPLAVVVAGAFGTFFFLIMLSGVSSGLAGYIVGLIGAMGVMGTCIWTAVRFPLTLNTPLVAAQPAFVRTFGALLGSQTLALVCGIVYWMVSGVARGVG
jgi:hypothetical protein